MKTYNYPITNEKLWEEMKIKKMKKGFKNINEALTYMIKEFVKG